MKTVLFVALAISSSALANSSHAPTEEEIRAKQTLGRALISPDGRFFVYEWMRPYSRVRNTRSLPKSAAERMQTWIYRVDVNASPATPEYLVFPGSADSYWLGAFSPDGGKLSLYRLDNDNNVVKAGAVALTDPVTPKLTWFEPAPDAGKLDQPPVWISNDELVYATGGKHGAKWRANANTGATKPCNKDCAALLAQAKPAPAVKSKGGKPADGERVLAQSGDLSVYERSDSRMLALAFRKGADAPETVVFENERRLAAWSAPK